MNPTSIPGNEPDSGDMSTEPVFGTPDDGLAEHGLPDNEADELGNFA
ncbi:hypothetical protein [Sphingomonas xinjiangensis]|uniref:Uncharacterized protein n=1 Tax=Sphingomonas xinjiangensis TaxID=643568 RepID=A0A840YTS9_9SPHN|nr:hypothetical protein [Sphingomonas xinjiangensis]MBB5713023.1 hypothetical protein [Sphingomonas xinjiangensis]